MKRIIIALCMLYLFGGNLSAKVVLPQILSDHAVLQQQTEVKLWGKAVPNTTVNVTPSWNNQTITAQSDNEGRWQVSIQTPAADFTPYSIEFSDGEITRIQNILIGEVWFCSGQSNMEMPLNGFWNCPIEHANETIATSGEWNAIRMATIPKTGALTPQEHVAGSWKESNPFNAPYFSATAFNFARMLHRVLRVPVGIISCAWGGSRVEGWLPREVVEGFRDVDLKKEIKKPEKGKEWDYYTPTVMYNGMLKPLQRYTIRGFLWYQGESNVGKEKTYVERLRIMAELWRKEWGKRELPFYLVEIEEVGKRLAYLALNKTYQYGSIACEYPSYWNMSIQSDTVELTFHHADEGLSPWKDIKGFEIAGADKVFYPAVAVLVPEKKTIRVHSDKVKHPVAVRYCFHNFQPGNLKNHRGMPVIPFRTDHW